MNGLNSLSASQDTPRHSTGGVRPVFLWTGSLLWGVVIVALVVVWQNQRQRDTDASANERTNPPTDAAGTETKVLTIPVNTATDGQVINLSDLMGQAKPAADVPLWDPNGIEEFSFTNCDGRTVTKADLLGKPWAICFVFTKCLGTCPIVTRQLKTLQDRLKDADVRLVTLTVDPARDTPEVLLDYAKVNGADLDKWYFLTGDQTAIYGLIHRSFKMPVQEVTGPTRQEGFEIIHSTNVMLVDAEGVVSAKFNAAKDEDMVSLRKELSKLSNTP